MSTWSNKNQSIMGKRKGNRNRSGRYYPSKKKMGNRRWEELNQDCLVEVLRKLDIESLLTNVPLVCKSWYKASLDPKCWKCLNFHELASSPYLRPPYDSPFFDDFNILNGNNDLANAFIKFVVDRSQRCATTLVIAGFFTQQSLEYVSQECPELKCLNIPMEFMFGDEGQHLSKFIGSWGNLELLSIEICYYLDQILTPISTHCHKFQALCCREIQIRDEDAMAIVTLEQKIKYLRLSSCRLSRENVVMILKGCRHLELLIMRYCSGFNVDDEILKLASHIKTFDYQGTYA